MRLTIVDRDCSERGVPLVVEVYQVGILTPETFAMLTESATANYSDRSFTWLVSACGEMPAHGEHNEWGQLAHPDWFRPAGAEVRS